MTYQEPLLYSNLRICGYDLSRRRAVKENLELILILELRWLDLLKNIIFGSHTKKQGAAFLFDNKTAAASLKLKKEQATYIRKSELKMLSSGSLIIGLQNKSEIRKNRAWEAKKEIVKRAPRYNFLQFKPSFPAAGRTNGGQKKRVNSSLRYMYVCKSLKYRQPRASS